MNSTPKSPQFLTNSARLMYRVSFYFKDRIFATLSTIIRLTYKRTFSCEKGIIKSSSEYTCGSDILEILRSSPASVKEEVKLAVYSAT